MKVSELTTISSLTTDDLVYVIDDPSGTPASKKCAISSVLALQLNIANTWTAEQTFSKLTHFIGATVGINSWWQVKADDSATNPWLRFANNNSGGTVTFSNLGEITATGGLTLNSGGTYNTVNFGGGNTLIRSQTTTIQYFASSHNFYGPGGTTAPSIFNGNVTAIAPDTSTAGLTIKAASTSQGTPVFQIFRSDGTTNIFSITPWETSGNIQGRIRLPISNAGIWVDGGGVLHLAAANETYTARLTSAAYDTWANRLFRWASANNTGGTLGAQTYDTGIGRNAAGVVEINTGTAGTLGSLITNTATFSSASTAEHESFRFSYSGNVAFYNYVASQHGGATGQNVMYFYVRDPVSGHVCPLTLSDSNANFNKPASFSANALVGVSGSNPQGLLDVRASSVTATDSLVLSYSDTNYRHRFVTTYSGSGAANNTLTLYIASSSGVQTQAMQWNGAGNIAIGGNVTYTSTTTTQKIISSRTAAVGLKLEFTDGGAVYTDGISIGSNAGEHYRVSSRGINYGYLVQRMTKTDSVGTENQLWTFGDNQSVLYGGNTGSSVNPHIRFYNSNVANGTAANSLQFGVASSTGFFAWNFHQSLVDTPVTLDIRTAAGVKTDRVGNMDGGAWLSSGVDDAVDSQTAWVLRSQNTLTQTNSRLFALYNNTSDVFNVSIAGKTTLNGIVMPTGNMAIGLSATKMPVVDIVTGNNTTYLVNDSTCIRLRSNSTDGNCMTVTMGVGTGVNWGGAGQGFAYIQPCYWGGSYDNPLVLCPSGGQVVVGASMSKSTWAASISGTLGIHSTSNGNSGALGGKIAFSASGYIGENAFIAGIFDDAAYYNGEGLVFYTNNGADVAGADTGTEKFRIGSKGNFWVWSTNTAAGTTGAQTIDKASGTVNFAAGASTLVVTNALVTTSSIVFAVIRTNDSTAQIKNVVPASGSFTITLSATATAETSVGFFVIN